MLHISQVQENTKLAELAFLWKKVITVTMKGEYFALTKEEGALFSRDWYTLMAQALYNSVAKAKLKIHIDVKVQP